MMTFSVMDAPVGLEFLLRRARERQAALEAQAHALRDKLPACVDLLVKRFGATRVVLFGSLAHGGLHEESDVELAAAGISSAEHLAAASELERLLGATVDLVRLEEASDSLRRRIADDGVALHES